MAASDVMAAASDVSAFLAVKPDATVKEYEDCFWTHADKSTLVVKGKTFEFPFNRSTFCKESMSTIYADTKDPKELVVNIYGADMEKMGQLMGGATFQTMGELLWDMHGPPMVRTEAPPAEGKADLSLFITVKEGTRVEDYLELFWSHAEKTTLVCKGQSYEVPATRGSICDETKTKVYQNTKNSQQLLICIYGCEMDKMGEIFGCDAFKAMGDLMWSMDKMEFLAALPPPPSPSV